MLSINKHLIRSNTPIKGALARLNELALDAIVFVIDENGKLIGSLTDGDVRRGFLNGLTLDDVVDDFLQGAPKFLQRGQYSIEDVISLRRNNFKVIPVLSKQGTIVNIINFRFHKSYLPVDAVLMAGGRGERLRPLTDTTPKPLLKIGQKPIIEHNLERLISFGIDDFWISVKYLGKLVEEYLGDGRNRNVHIEYVWESEPLGTIGAVSKIDNFKHEYVLLTNSDVLTDLDYEQFFLNFLELDADLAVVTIPYQVNIPYAVLETSNGHILDFKEKPTYTYYSNGGIYLMKREVLKHLPYNSFFNATDLLAKLIAEGMKVVSFPMVGYWLDIGKHEDFEKAQLDIERLRL